MPLSRPVLAKRALLSVSDKTGLVAFARALSARGIALVSTGGTAKALADAGLNVTDVSAITGVAEMMDGRVKTLHPKIHGGILAVRDNPGHRAALEQHQIPEIDIVVIDLYPFEQTLLARPDADEIIEQIDIGGPAMIRAAAKNHADVLVVVDVADHAAVLAELEAGQGTTSLEFRQQMAGKAFARTATYDAAVAGWFSGTSPSPLDTFHAIGGKLSERLRYGENPHQTGALYLTTEARAGVATARQVQGKTLSFNNIADADAAFEAVAEFVVPAIVIVKHANPCGAATALTLENAYRAAYACDPVSAFGGIVAANRTLDEPTAREIVKIFTEVIVAPDADAAALAILATKPNLRLLLTGSMPDPHAAGLVARTVAGGLLVQSRDDGSVDLGKLKVVTKKEPSPAEMADMIFAFTIAKHVKSNAIVYAHHGATVGIGAGQMSRLDSARIAAIKASEVGNGAGSPTIGSVAASDAFFPFADGLHAIIEAGATAVIQPGGSIRDNDVIAAADAAGISMVFTDMRHFRH